MSDVLSDLPVELLDQIFAQVSRESRQSLTCIARVCKHFQDIVEPHLYRSIHNYDWTHVDSLEKAFSSKPGRAEMVRSFTIQRMDTNPGWDHDRQEYEPVGLALLPRFTRLEYFVVQVHHSHIRWEEWHDIFQRAARGEILRSLKTCYLNVRPAFPELELSHSVYEKSTIFNLEDVLYHPTLTKLSIFRVETELQWAPRALQAPTMLRRLEFLDSEVTPSVLYQVLSVTQNLKELFVHSQDQDDFDELDWEYSEYSEALEQVSATLETLVMTRNSGPTSEDHIRLKNMVALEFVAADLDTWFGNYWEEGAQHNPEEILREVLPPRLQTMAFFEWRGWEDYHWQGRRCIDESLHDILEPMFSNKRVFAPALKQIDFDATRRYLWGHYPVRSEVTQEFRKSCEDNGIALTLTKRDHFSPAAWDPSYRRRQLQKAGILSAPPGR